MRRLLTRRPISRSEGPSEENARQSRTLLVHRKVVIIRSLEVRMSAQTRSGCSSAMKCPPASGTFRSGGRCRRGRQVGAGRAADPIFEIAVMVHRPVVEFVDYPGGQADRRIDKCCSDCVGPCEHDLAVAPVAPVVRR